MAGEPWVRPYPRPMAPFFPVLLSCMDRSADGEVFARIPPILGKT